jgi:hypothetical protein
MGRVWRSAKERWEILSTINYLLICDYLYAVLSINQIVLIIFNFYFSKKTIDPAENSCNNAD